MSRRIQNQVGAPRGASSPELACHCIDDFERAARELLPHDVYEYYASGAGGEAAVRANDRAFDDFVIWPRVCRGVSAPDTTVELKTGDRLPHPVAIGPAALHRLAHPDGEQATARGAGESGALMVLSTLASVSLEDVAKAAGGPKWFQLYIHRDRGVTKELVFRAEASGYSALTVTLDAPVLGRRLADYRNDFKLPEDITFANLSGANSRMASSDATGATQSDWVASNHDPTVTLCDLEWLQSLSSLPVVAKGVLRADDALEVSKTQVAGIVVSNHGGRQLDGAPTALEALPPVVDAVGDRTDILMDGGVKWGSDVLKALGLGAKAVLIARPALWGLAVGGDRGVARVVDLIREDLKRAMILIGCQSLSDVCGDTTLVTRRAR